MAGRRWAIAAVAVLGLGCGFDVVGDGDTEAQAGSSGEAAQSASSSSPTATTTAGGTSTATSGTTAGVTTDEPTDTDGSETTGGPIIGCPDPLPASWIYCQDFEDIEDLETDFDTLFTDDGNFAVDDVVAFSGQRAMRIRYTQAGDDWAGEAWVRFGDADTDGPVFAPGEVFDEIWARVYIRTQDEWPGGGIGSVIGVEARDGPQNARVLRVGTTAPTGNEELFMQARSCIEDGSLQCDGTQDWNNDRVLDTAGGQAVVASPEAGPQWHCVVLHVALNTVGASDGFAEQTVDGGQDATLVDLDLRGSWDQTGLNTVRIESAWGGGGPAGPVERYLDDLVVSTTPLDCV